MVRLSCEIASTRLVHYEKGLEGSLGRSVLNKPMERLTKRNSVRPHHYPIQSHAAWLVIFQIIETDARLSPTKTSKEADGSLLMFWFGPCLARVL